MASQKQRLRITVSLDEKTWDAIDMWADENGLVDRSKALRALVALAMSKNIHDGSFRAAYEQYLAELREQGRQVTRAVVEQMSTTAPPHGKRKP